LGNQKRTQDTLCITDVAHGKKENITHDADAFNSTEARYLATKKAGSQFGEHSEFHPLHKSCSAIMMPIIILSSSWCMLFQVFTQFRIASLSAWHPVSLGMAVS